MQRGQHHTITALRQGGFLLFSGSRFLSGAGQTMQQAAIAWQVYAISGSPLQLGILGLVRFLPALAISLVGGVVADTRDRKTIIMLSQLVPLGASAALLLLTVGGAINLPLIYGLVVALALASSFENPARQALLPQLVPRQAFASAVTVSSTIQQLAFVFGPTVAGLAIASVDVQGAYGVHVALTIGAMVQLAFIRLPNGEQIKGDMSFAMVKEGLQFVRHRRVLLGAMALDMFAVVFASAQALLPVYAEDVLKVGARGYGLLSSAQAIGAFLMALALMLLPSVQRTGRALLITVAGFGLATIAFGLARSFPLSLLTFALTGATDQISVVMRQTTIQLATPDELRGRVSSINMVFIGASNQVGSVRAGAVAAVTDASFAVVSGGLGCLAVVAAIAVWVPELWRYHISQGAALDEPVKEARTR